MDVPEIERLLDYRTLIPNRDVEACIAELEALARADLEAPKGSSRHSRGLISLKAIREYSALRVLARQQGWASPLEEDWPLRVEAGGPSLPQQAAAEPADAATVLLDRLQAIKAEAESEAAQEVKTRVSGWTESA